MAGEPEESPRGARGEQAAVAGNRGRRTGERPGSPREAELAVAGSRGTESRCRGARGA